jgi:hypothetical protein
MYINSRALLAKGLEWMESGESKRFKGVIGSLTRHKKRIYRVTGKITGLSAKSPHLISYLWPADRGTSGSKSPELWAACGSGKARNR